MSPHFIAPVSGGLSQAKGQNPHNLRHSRHQTSQDEPGSPEWCTGFSPPVNDFHRVFHWILMVHAFVFLAVVQREIQQHPRPADLSSHHAPADALLPRQRNHQRGAWDGDSQGAYLRKKLLLSKTSNDSVCFQLKYKEDLMWLRGLGCFLYDTPEMVHVRNITKQRVRDRAFILKTFWGIYFSVPTLNAFNYVSRWITQWRQRRTWLTSQWSWIHQSTTAWLSWSHTWATWVDAFRIS